MSIILATAEICTAFQTLCIGTKVLEPYHRWFTQILHDSIAAHVFPENGQAKILLPDITRPMVSAGIASREELREGDFVARKFRNRVGLYARRKFAMQSEKVFAIVYTRDAYIADPDYVEGSLFGLPDYTHVLVALLGHAGPEDVPYGSRVLLHNMAGGNNEFLPSTGPNWVESMRNTLAYYTPKDADACSFTVMVPSMMLEQGISDIQMLREWIRLAQKSEAYEKEYVGVSD